MTKHRGCIYCMWPQWFSTSCRFWVCDSVAFSTRKVNAYFTWQYSLTKVSSTNRNRSITFKDILINSEIVFSDIFLINLDVGLRLLKCSKYPSARARIRICRILFQFKSAYIRIGDRLHPHLQSTGFPDKDCLARKCWQNAVQRHTHWQRKVKLSQVVTNKKAVYVFGRREFWIS